MFSFLALVFIISWFYQGCEQVMPGDIPGFYKKKCARNNIMYTKQKVLIMITAKQETHQIESLPLKLSFPKSFENNIKILKYTASWGPKIIIGTTCRKTWIFSMNYTFKICDKYCVKNQFHSVQLC